MTELTLQVPDIECDACAQSIQNALSQNGGVSGVKVDVEGKRVELSYDETETTEETIRETLEEAGFSPA